MVLIIKKVFGKRCDLIFLPKITLNEFLSRHVDRKGLARGRLNTCLVDNKHLGAGKPLHGQVTKLLIETIRKMRVTEGELRYPIPHHLFNNLQCQDFDYTNNMTGPSFEGDFVINYMRIKGKSRLAVRELRGYESFGIFEAVKIKNTILKAEKNYETNIFKISHVHPARRR